MDLNERGVVVFSSSNDGVHMADNVLSKSRQSNFFVTNGLFPQEIVIKFEVPVIIISAAVISLGIRKIEFQVCESVSNEHWKSVFISDANEADHLEFQRLSIEIPKAHTNSISLLKIRILGGYNDFVVINKLSLIGSVPNL